MRLATRSRTHAVAAVLGISLGALFWLTLTVLGAAALLTAFPWLLRLLQVAGGAWIIYMGATMVRSGLGEPPADIAEAQSSLPAPRVTFLHGLSTNLSNPKIVLFLAALIAPLLPPSPGVGVALAVILAMWSTAMAAFLVISLVVSTDAVRRRMLRAGPWIDLGAGAFFLLAGSGLVVRGVLG